jgi:5-methylthioadenosine/S-adenosylhomocysteine deaminase
VLSMVAGEPARRADVFIEGGRIVGVGPAREPFSIDEASVIEASGCVVMPGLINAHTHTPMTVARGTMEGAGFPGPDSKPSMPPGQDWRGRLTADDHEVAARLAIAEMIRSGTTTFVDMYRDMDRVARAVVDSGMRAALGWEIITFRNDPGQWLPYDEKTARRTFEESGRFASDWHGRGDGRISAWIAPHETSTCHQPWLSRAVELATQLDLGIVLHVAESTREVDFCQAEYGASPIELLSRIGALERRVIGAHSIYLSDSDIQILSRSRFSAAACLGCYLKLATDITPVPRLLAAGVNVALGTDSGATNNNLNIWDEIHLNATLHGFQDRDPTLVPGDTALRLATVGGAIALGLEQELGTIEPGKRADIIVVEIDAPHLTPAEGALVANLTHSATGHEVRDVLVDGRVLMRQRRIVSFDEGAVLEAARAMVRRRRSVVGLPQRYEQP